MFDPSSDLFIHHPGFRVIMFSVYTKKNSRGTFRMIAASENKAKIESIKPGKIGLQIIVPDEKDEIDPEKEKFILFVFEHHKSRQRRQITVIVSPAANSSGVHTVLTADDNLVLFDGIVPFGSDSPEFEPVFLNEIQTEQDAAANP